MNSFTWPKLIVVKVKVKFIDWAVDTPLKDAGRVTMSKKTLASIRELIEYLYISIYNKGLESWKQLVTQG